MYLYIIYYLYIDLYIYIYMYIYIYLYTKTWLLNLLKPCIRIKIFLSKGVSCENNRIQ